MSLVLQYIPGNAAVPGRWRSHSQGQEKERFGRELEVVVRVKGKVTLRKHF